VVIPSISSFQTSFLSPITTKMNPTNSSPAEAQKQFADYLKESINSVNTSQNFADGLTQRLANGENVDLQQVMVAAQKASITLQTTMEVRNKVVEAYQEIMRMQM
jgi:flagellar hook-basal body complex protein FliE